SPGDSSRGRKMGVSEISEGKVLNTFCHGSKEKDIKRAVNYHKKQKLNDFDCRQLGSAAIELAFVAAGRTESIVIPGAHPWDVAAGVLLVREAGGKVTDSQGRDWNLKSRDMLASNGLIYKQLLRSLN
ncbi:MAG TPA: inositol monophosphatase family protein, partial [Patescibacteria group bacterium]|nr:inositol monophosphatase family protein [Patescibacteria group bacterium]